jgi:hypothetical protein
MTCAAGCPESSGEYGLCGRCEHLLAGLCLGKKRHWRKRNAQLAAADGGPTEKSYQCDVCMNYHVGHLTGHSEELQEARRDVIRRLRQRGNGALLTQLADQWRWVSRARWKAGRRGGLS